MIVNSIIYQTLFLLYAAVANADSADYDYGVTSTAVGCSIPMQKKAKRTPGAGFDIRIFQYDFENMELGYEEDFMASGYASNTLEYSLTSVGDINFAGSVPDGDTSVPYEATLFGKTFYVSNFVAELTSYFGVAESGFYKFESINTEDSMMLFIGAGSALKCCSVASNLDFSIFSASSYNIFTASHNASTQSYYQYLEAGYLYPIRIVYANTHSDYSMQFQITYPDGTVITEFDIGYFNSPAYISHFWDTGHCFSKTVSAEAVLTSWTGSTTSYSTYYPTGEDDGLTGYFYYPDPTTTVTAHYYGSTISSNTATPTGAGTWIESIFYPEETVTSYVPWTGATTETSTTFIPDDPEVPATVVIKIPDAITTNTIQWTGAETSSSTIYPENGQNGTITVEIFTPRDIATSTVLWTGNLTSTYTTIFPEDVNGTVIVGVEIPRETATVTDFWSGSSTSYATEFPSDADGEIIVHEYVPQSVISGDIVYITTYWIGDFTSYSTANPGYSNGTTTVFVGIPQQVITETWTGLFTSTTFYCPYSGAASTPVILVPSSTTAPESPEICKSCKSSPTSSNESSRSFSSDSTESPESSSSLPPSNNSSVSSFNGPSESSLAESSESFSSTQDAVIDYSNNGNRLLSLNLGFIISLLSTFYIII